MFGNEIICCIHNKINISNMARKIIETEEFQRLGKIRQLGINVYVFPSSTHTRLEHSLGTYHLTGIILDILQKKYPHRKYEIPELEQDYLLDDMNQIKKNTTGQLDQYSLTLSPVEQSILNDFYSSPFRAPAEIENSVMDKFDSVNTKANNTCGIELTPRICELIKIAGLCHDIGHGPFSHTFDYIASKKHNHPNRHHEVRSALILENICREKLSDELSEKEIRFMQSVISPEKHNRGAIYQIVANYLNGIDVDKLDYLARDSYMSHISLDIDTLSIINGISLDADNNIIYSLKNKIDITNIFVSRYQMHLNIYGHPSAKIMEVMLCDLLHKIDAVYNITSTIYDIKKFCKLTDETIFEFLKIYNYQIFNVDITKSKEIDSAFKIYQRIINREPYAIIADGITKAKVQNFFEFLKKKQIDAECVRYIYHYYGFSSTPDFNPLKNISFYEENKIFGFDEKGLFKKYQKEIHLLICTDTDKTSFYQNLWEQFEKH